MNAQQIPTFAFYMKGWKHEIFRRFFPDRAFTFIPLFPETRDFEKEWGRRILKCENPEIFVWSLRAPKGLKEFAARNDIPVYHIEDGFIRSVEANAGRSTPLSLTFDRQTAYFDSRSASDLESLLATFDFDGNPELLNRAAEGIRLLLKTGVSKYNTDKKVDIEALYGPKTRKRILVIGQVESDASIEFGCQTPMTNNDLVQHAADENPDAQIIYKPHPDVLNRVRGAKSNPEDVKHICQVITTPLSLAQAFETIDHVYTMTSLAGFEALLRGLPVTAFGGPFYAGWGLTDDRQPNPRRGRKLSIEALFAGAYLLYPRYFDPHTGQGSTFEETTTKILRHLSGEKMDFSVPKKAPPKWEPWGPYGLLGWRHVLPFFVTPIVKKIGNKRDAEVFREDPILFFRELANPKQRFIGRLLYPFDE